MYGNSSFLFHEAGLMHIDTQHDQSTNLISKLRIKVSLCEHIRKQSPCQEAPCLQLSGNQCTSGNVVLMVRKLVSPFRDRKKEIH